MFELKRSPCLKLSDQDLALVDQALSTWDSPPFVKVGFSEPGLQCLLEQWDLFVHSDWSGFTLSEYHQDRLCRLLIQIAIEHTSPSTSTHIRSAASENDDYFKSRMNCASRPFVHEGAPVGDQPYFWQSGSIHPEESYRPVSWQDEIEVTTGYLHEHELWQEMRRLPRILQRNGVTDVTVDIDRMSHIPEEYQHRTLQTTRIWSHMKRIRDGRYIALGDRDVYIRSVDASATIQFCHESDIHLFTKSRKLADRIIRHWQDQGFACKQRVDGSWHQFSTRDNTVTF